MSKRRRHRSVSLDDQRLVGRLEHLDEDLKKVVFGQDAAIQTVVRAVKRGRCREHELPT